MHFSLPPCHSFSRFPSAIFCVASSPFFTLLNLFDIMVKYYFHPFPFGHGSRHISVLIHCSLAHQPRPVDRVVARTVPKGTAYGYCTLTFQCQTAASQEAGPLNRYFSSREDYLQYEPCVRLRDVTTALQPKCAELDWSSRKRTGSGLKLLASLCMSPDRPTRYDTIAQSHAHRHRTSLHLVSIIPPGCPSSLVCHTLPAVG